MNVIANPVTCSHHSYGLPSATLRVAYYTISIRQCIGALAPGLVLRYVWRITCTQSASAGAFNGALAPGHIWAISLLLRLETAPVPVSQSEHSCYCNH